ncbi:PEGA domain-containing protein [Myxococcota bacterium]|nr:PEGA domain-containing protein [Myxococcota bacterium]
MKAQSTLLIILSLLFSSSQLHAEEPSSEKRVLVMDIKAIEIEESIIPVLTGEIAKEISSHDGYKASSLEELRAVTELNASKKLMGCEGNSACIAEVSSQLNAELVLGGSIGKLGNSFVLSLNLTDSKTATSVGNAEMTAESVDALTASLPTALAQLFDWNGETQKTKFRLPEGKAYSFAVFDLKPTGVSKAIADNLTQILSGEIKRTEGTSVISRDDIVAMLQLDEQKLELGCDDASCIAEIGGALGVDKLVVGNVGRLGESYVITLRLLDAKSATVDNRLSESFKGSDDQLIDALKYSVRTLLGIDQEGVGQIVVTASQEEVAVKLNGDTQGKLPIPPLSNLEVGRHSLRLVKKGFFDWRGDVYVNPNGTTVVWAEMKERPAKWYQKWWVWGIAAGVAIVGGTAAIYASQPAPTTGSGTATVGN